METANRNFAAGGDAEWPRFWGRCSRCSVWYTHFARFEFHQKLIIIFLAGNTDYNRISSGHAGCSMVSGVFVLQNSLWKCVRRESYRFGLHEMKIGFVIVWQRTLRVSEKCQSTTSQVKSTDLRFCNSKDWLTPPTTLQFSFLSRNTHNS